MDVRAVAVAQLPDDVIVTGSRDKTTRIWKTNELETSYIETQCMTGPTNFVSSVCYVPPTEQYAYGLIIAGSNDCSIYAFSIDSPLPKYKLLGHSGTVCSLTSGKFGTVVSGSWDKTARIWLGQKCMMTLEGHQAAVWAVHILPAQGLTLTGSADKTIRMWRAGKCEKVFTGHDDCVRDIASNSAIEFLSCSNDATVRLWAVTGECLRVYQGHTNFIYSIAIIPDTDKFATAGEDRCIKIWRLPPENASNCKSIMDEDDECLQTIPVPAQSIWSMACLSNGDIVSGSSDGVARVFSRHPQRQGNEDILKEYEEEIANSSLPATDLGGIQLSELPGKEVLYEPGKRDGQTKLVRDGDKVSCHQWESSSGRWIRVGEVMGASGGTNETSGKVLYEGKEFDYVFNVDLDGEMSLKLPYNLGDDPWIAAQKFIHDNDLSQYYLEQVANFIIQNTKGSQVAPSAQSQAFDPFTGASRYVPGGPTVQQEMQKQNQQSSATDPFTGAGRYVPTYSQGNETDSSTSRSAGLSDSTMGNPYFPQKTFVRFESAPNISGLLSKLREFNVKVSKDLQLQEENLKELEELLKVTTTNDGKPTNSQIQLLIKILQWPSNYIFPALDILRLVLRIPDSNEVLSELCGVDLLVNKILPQLQTNNSPPANHMLSLRSLNNWFSHSAGQSLLVNQKDLVLGASMNCVDSSNKNIQVALSTLLLNYAVLLAARGVNVEEKLQCLSGAGVVLQKVTDHEAMFRILVGFGTLMWGDPESIAFARTLDVQNALERLSDISDPPKVGQCATYLATLLK